MVSTWAAHLPTLPTLVPALGRRDKTHTVTKISMLCVCVRRAYRHQTFPLRIYSQFLFLFILLLEQSQKVWLFIFCLVVLEGIKGSTEVMALLLKNVFPILLIIPSFLFPLTNLVKLQELGTGYYVQSQGYSQLLAFQLTFVETITACLEQHSWC